MAMPLNLFEDLRKAVFLDRPNRFIARCRLGRRTVTAHMPNPGRMWELLLPDAALYLARRSPGTECSTEYSVVGVERDGVPVLLHTGRTNDVAAYLFRQQRIPGLESYRLVQQEYTVGRSRFDLLLEGPAGRMVVEVKSCTLFGHGVAMFPDAITERGRRHLLHLAELSRQGLKTGVLFIVHCPEGRYFLPDYHTDLEFSRAFLEVRDAVALRAVAVGWDQGLRLREDCVRELSVPYDLIAREAVDAGVYMVILHVDAGCDIDIGSLGTRHFNKGYYVYVGSARKNLQARLDRHRRLRKNLFWHIDYLRCRVSFCAAVPVRGTLVSECGLAAAVAEVSAWQVPGFGCSDCGCPSHLFAMNENPLKDRAFIDMLLRLRMGSLVPHLPEAAAAEHMIF